MIFNRPERYRLGAKGHAHDNKVVSHRVTVALGLLCRHNLGAK
jgi:hypothetical protein